MNSWFSSIISENLRPPLILLAPSFKNLRKGCRFLKNEAWVKIIITLSKTAGIYEAKFLLFFIGITVLIAFIVSNRVVFSRR